MLDGILPLIIAGIDTHISGLRVGKQGNTTIKRNKMGGNTACLC